MRIKNVVGREILVSQENPTVEAKVTLNSIERPKARSYTRCVSRSRSHIESSVSCISMDMSNSCGGGSEGGSGDDGGGDDSSGGGGGDGDDDPASGLNPLEFILALREIGLEVNGEAAFRKGIWELSLRFSSKRAYESNLLS